MRKIRPNDNNFAEAGRLSKAAALADTIREHYGPISQELIDVLPTQSNDWWVSLSKASGVNPPSPATVEALIGMLAQDIPVSPWGKVSAWDDMDVRR